MREAKEVLREILRKRGMETEEEIAEFLSDRPQKTYDPFLLLNMEAGVDLLLSEIKSGGRICIYGDYDADGVTSVCILWEVLEQLTENLTYYIPSRFDEGYGLNKEAIAAIKEDGAGLLLTVDCGSVSCEEVEFAKSLGIKVIVTDHHTIDGAQADCLLINPKQKNCPYPFKELAGCGVAFKLAQAVRQQVGLPKKAVGDLLDLVAVGTVGDIVSLTDENRTLVKYGLNRLNAGGRPALKKLAQAISIPWITSERIAFGIAPHINAAGRMGSAREAVKLLQACDEGKMDDSVAKLVEFNGRRKQKQEEAFRACLESLSGEESFAVLHMPEIHEGIAGIAAGKVKEEINRPVVIVTPSGEGFLKGTGRSVEKVDIYGLLKKHDNLFQRFGGHRSACGFLMAEENLPRLRQAVEEEMTRLLAEEPDLLTRKARWDLTLAPEEITLELAKTLDRMEPFGQGNPRPVFALEQVEIHSVRFMGAEETHVRFTAKSESAESTESGKGGGGCQCVLFQKAQEYRELLAGGGPLCIVGAVNVQNWKGKESVQFIAEEIMPCI